MDLIRGKKPEWRGFFFGLELGDSVTFIAKGTNEVMTIRAAAYQFNLRERDNKPFRIKVSATPKETPISVTIIAEPKAE